MKRNLYTILISLMMTSYLYAQDSIIQLPAPKMHGGDSLMNCLKNRATKREYSNKELSLQMLSDLLWAANGINRPEEKKRTAPTARNWQDIDLYVVLHSGIYLWDDSSYQLKLIKSGDYMKETGKQNFVEEAPLNIIIVSNTSKMDGVAKDQIMLYAGLHAGYISQNLYLFCASEGLNTVARHYIDIEKISKTLGLKADQLVVLAQTVGFPAE